MYKVRVEERPDYGPYLQGLQNRRSAPLRGMPVDQDMYLPVINGNRVQDIERENKKNVQRSLNVLHDKSVRAIRQNNPWDNVPLYNPDVSNFLQNYPANLPYYRPIRYFYQKPVQVQPKFAYPHNVGLPREGETRDGVIKELNKVITKKYAKPIRMDEIIKMGNELHFPTSTIISKENLQKQLKENEDILLKAHQLKSRRLKEKTTEYWKRLRKWIILINFWHILRRFVQNKLLFKSQAETLDKTVRYHALELLNYLVSSMKGQVEHNVKIYLVEKIKYDGPKDKVEDSYFRTKTFIHNLMNCVVSGFSKKDEIPGKIKRIFLDMVSEKVTATPDFLSTFEFNRLEFDCKIRLKNMTIDRKALMVGFIFLYRIFITEVMSDILKYFPDTVNQAKKEKEDYLKISKAQLDKNYFAKIGLKENKKLSEIVNNAETYEEEIAKLEDNIRYNCDIITQILAYLVQDTFSGEPKLYKEYFKEKHLYFDLVQESEERDLWRKARGTGKSNQGIYYEGLINDDMVEFYSIDNEEALKFIKENYKWVQLTKHTIFGFCVNLVDNISS